MAAQPTIFGDTAENTFFLRSINTSIVANGIFKRINTPAADGADLQGTFQTSIRNSISEAKNAGIDSPIVVGVIPFDPKKESALYIPRSWRKQTDEETNSQVHAQPSSVEEGAVNGVADSQLHPEYDEFKQIVADAVEEIRQGNLDKVVLSRLQTITTAKPIDSLSLLKRLIQQNPKGFNFHVPLADGSRLIGSSPELLLRKDGEHFYTKPLAGSAGRGPTEKEDKAVPETLINSPKDRHEHKLVVDSIRDTLAPRSRELDVPDCPECISTPKLWHLATAIKGAIKKESEESALSLAALLHPTPALSGFPHDKAHKLLTKLEPFDREYFGGIVGYCDLEGNGEWFITIRSGRVSEQKVQLFAGAGIVGDSVPDSEWRETGIKLSTMLQAFDI